MMMMMTKNVVYELGKVFHKEIGNGKLILVSSKVFGCWVVDGGDGWMEELGLK